jgi:hypothetical protein
VIIRLKKEEEKENNTNEALHATYGTVLAERSRQQAGGMQQRINPLFSPAFPPHVM